MAKRQKLSSIEFEDLPDELILQVLNNLDIEDIANCVRVSKSIRAICRDVSIFYVTATQAPGDDFFEPTHRKMIKYLGNVENYGCTSPS